MQPKFSVHRLLHALMIAVIGIALIGSANASAALAQAGREVLVTTAEDSGPDSLRAALQNARPGDIIRFDPAVFPPDTHTTILLESPLPELDFGQVAVDATGTSVTLDGSLLHAAAAGTEQQVSGIQIVSDGNRIQGLQIINFPGNAISIRDGRSNQIGGARPNATAACVSPCNLLSGNTLNGILVEGGGQNRIQGNFVGADITGRYALGNQGTGIQLLRSEDNLIGGQDGEGNLVAANFIQGIDVLDPLSVGNRVVGNMVGLDISGHAPLGNRHCGIKVAYRAISNLVENNIVAGNEAGICIEEDSYHNTISHNYVGTNPTLDKGIGNRYSGVELASVYDNTIGPGNVIAWNRGEGIFYRGNPLYGNKITQNTIVGNSIGSFVFADSGGQWPDAPSDLTIANRTITGRARPGADIELYTGMDPQGGRYLGSTTADSQGQFSWAIPPETELEVYVLALSFDEDGTTSTFSRPLFSLFYRFREELREQEPILRELPGILGPEQISTDPEVLVTNAFFAVGLLIYLYLMGTIFNKTLEDTLPSVFSWIVSPIQKTLSPVVPARKFFKALRRTFAPSFWLKWIAFLIPVSLVQSWLDPGEISVFERLSLAATLLLAALLIGAIEITSERIFRHRVGQPANEELTAVRWEGLGLAAATTAISRLIHFTPGFALGTVDAFSCRPVLKDANQAGQRILNVEVVMFIVTFAGWFFSKDIGASSTSVAVLLQTAFVLVLEALCIELIPFLRILDGSALFKWKPWIWLTVYVPVAYFSFWLIFNPAESGVQAIQQNSILALLFVIVFLPLMLIGLTLILKHFRLQGDLPLE